MPRLGRFSQNRSHITEWKSSAISPLSKGSSMFAPEYPMLVLWIECIFLFIYYFFFFFCWTCIEICSSPVSWEPACTLNPWSFIYAPYKHTTEHTTVNYLQLRNIFLIWLLSIAISSSKSVGVFFLLPIQLTIWSLDLTSPVSSYFDGH